MTDWKIVQGSQTAKPQEFDFASSKVVVYQRRNIERITVDDTELWQYEEREMTHDEYINVRDMDLQSKIEYVAMMADVDMEG